MPTQKLTAEIRLYRWLKRKTTPPDAWQHLSLAELAAKARCSTSQVSRTLPKAVAKLHAISLDAAEKWVHDVMRVRRGHLIDFEIKILKALRKEQPPFSYRRLASLFEVSEKQIADISQSLALGAKCGVGVSSFGSLKTLIPQEFHHCIPQLQANAEIRRKLREKQRVCAAKRVQRESQAWLF